MPARLVADGDDHGAAVRDVFHLAFEYAQFRRIDLVVRGIDREQRCLDRGQVSAADRSRATNLPGTADRWRRLPACIGKSARRETCLHCRGPAPLSATAAGLDPMMQQDVQRTDEPVRLMRVLAVVPFLPGSRAGSSDPSASCAACSLRPEICTGNDASVGISASMESRIFLAPQPGVHAAHRRAHDRGAGDRPTCRSFSVSRRYSATATMSS